jgi:hypothetical protein
MQRTRWLLPLLALWTGPAFGWGDDGHRVVNGAAAAALPDDAPECLTQNQARLTYLGPEPDRWRYGDLTEMNKAMAPDHFLDYEMLEGKVDAAKPPKHRYAFIEALIKGGEDPGKVGLAPYRVVELCQRIEAAVVALEVLDPNDAQSAPERKQAEESLIYVTGVLGHYVADLGNPHHCTIHYNGWRGENPEGFATDRGTHSRFESVFVRRIVDQLQVQVTAAPRRDIDYVREVWALVQESNSLTSTLYRLDRDGSFTEGNEAKESGRRGIEFAQSRMTRAATLLRDMWATAIARGRVRAASVKLRLEIRERLFEEGIDVWVDVGLDLKVKLVGRLDDPRRARRALEIARAVPGSASVTSRVQSLY